MEIKELQTRLNAQGIKITEDAIANSLSQWAIAPSDITEDTLSEVINLFRGLGAGLATTGRAAATPTAPAKGKGKRGGNLKRQEMTTLPVVRTQEIRQDFEQLQEQQQNLVQEHILALADEVNALKASVDQVTAAAGGEMYEAIVSMHSAAVYKTVTLLEEEAASSTFRRIDYAAAFNAAIANAPTDG